MSITATNVRAQSAPITTTKAASKEDRGPSGLEYLGAAAGGGIVLGGIGFFSGIGSAMDDFGMAMVGRGMAGAVIGAVLGAAILFGVSKIGD